MAAMVVLCAIRQQPPQLKTPPGVATAETPPGVATAAPEPEPEAAGCGVAPPSSSCFPAPVSDGHCFLSADGTGIVVAHMFGLSDDCASLCVDGEASAIIAVVSPQRKRNRAFSVSVFLLRSVSI